MNVPRLSGLLRHPRLARLREALTPPAYPGVRLTPKRVLNLYLNRWQEARNSLMTRSTRSSIQTTDLWRHVWDES